MATNNWYERLEQYLDGELIDEARDRFEQEIAADPVKQRALADRRRFRDETRAALRGGLPNDLEKLATSFGRRTAPSRKILRFDRRWTALAIAAAVVLALVTPRLLRNIAGAEGPRSITQAGQVAAVRFGEMPGTTVMLEAGCYHLTTGTCE